MVEVGGRPFARGDELINSQQSLLFELAHIQRARPSQLVVIAAKLLSAADHDHVAAADGGFDEVVVALPGKFPKSEGVCDIPLDACEVAVFAR